MEFRKKSFRSEPITEMAMIVRRGPHRQRTLRLNRKARIFDESSAASACPAEMLFWAKLE